MIDPAIKETCRLLSEAEQGKRVVMKHADAAIPRVVQMDTVQSLLDEGFEIVYAAENGQEVAA